MGVLIMDLPWLLSITKAWIALADSDIGLIGRRLTDDYCCGRVQARKGSGARVHGLWLDLRTGRCS